MKKFEVTITPKFQTYAGAWASGEYAVEVLANTRNEAIKKARADYQHENGTLEKATFKARLAS